ncbi:MULTISPECIES: helix-turn-helix domain-containing protein [Cytobacillus]|uniref:HTH cro/C1-type domain-containing protein n=1 Tax=Cytobacillus oceanisediminis TaxID=665099 RepID=A0ABX3CNN2_9BACI|nr:helix-turn-helix domain-containing protein [Cytobacillus oceanisediminis]EFV75025.1 hypothetical protein HMPREF1013_04798 [Bacillus sp. 2_A_57_CT2]OHX45022.1 hypothetical protein BBV17_24160 [Cytobacillus oceanisediminis]
MELIQSLGKKIKEIRKVRGMKQYELAEGICSQAQISKIEKGQVEPLSSTLYLIANKLDVDVSYFFSNIKVKRNGQAHMLEKLKDARSNSDYQLIKQIVEENENSNSEKDAEIFSVLTWYKGLYMYYLYKDLSSSTDSFKQAIEYVNDNSLNKVEILVDMGIVLFDAEEYSISMKYLQDSLRKLEMSDVDSQELKVRILYNLISCLFELEKYKEAIYYCHLAINICIEIEKTSYFRELHYWLGELYEHIREYDRALFYYEYTINLYDGKRDTQLIKYLEDRSTTLKNIINTEKSLQKSKMSHRLNKKLLRNLA